MALFSEGSCICRGLCDLEKWSDWNQHSASLLHSCQQVKSNIQTNSHSTTRGSHFPKTYGFYWASIPATHLQISMPESKRDKRRRLTMWQTVLVILMPYLAFHIISLHLISSLHPSIHLKGWRNSRYSDWGWWSAMAMMTWETSQSQRPWLPWVICKWKAWAKNPHPQVLEVTFCTNSPPTPPNKAQLCLPSMEALLGWILPFGTWSHFPKGSFYRVNDPAS